MKRNLIPKSFLDRLTLAASIVILLALPFAIIDGAYWVTFIGALVAVVGFISVFVFPMDYLDPPTSVNEYSVVLESIEVIGKRLSELSRFLEKEGARVAETEATVKKLNDEKTHLEPLVQLQRETVEAILAAHAQRTARHAWKERLFGFALGLSASLIASFIFQYFKR